jgi:hypothetical protein
MGIVGHKAGDMLASVIANILRDCAPISIDLTDEGALRCS